MPHYHKLSSEKYYQEKVRLENEAASKQKKTLAEKPLTQFLFFLVVFLFTITVVQQMPDWLPVVTGLFN